MIRHHLIGLACLASLGCHDDGPRIGSAAAASRAAAVDAGTDAPTFAAIQLARSKSEFTGKCVGVSDGDTITVMHDGVGEKIRLQGIDCPESGQAFGSKAKQFTSDQCFGKILRVEPLDKDRYGRTIANVYLPGGAMLNQELVRAGLAWWYEKYAPHDQVLRQLQEEARAANRGLWADPEAIPPWEWRASPKQ